MKEKKKQKQQLCTFGFHSWRCGRHSLSTSPSSLVWNISFVDNHLNGHGGSTGRFEVPRFLRRLTWGETAILKGAICTHRIRYTPSSSSTSPFPSPDVTEERYHTNCCCCCCSFLLCFKDRMHKIRSCKLCALQVCSTFFFPFEKWMPDGRTSSSSVFLFRLKIRRQTNSNNFIHKYDSMYVHDE